MSTNKDGGSAFPVAGPNGSRGGMSLRDYFAAQALPAVMSAEPDSSYKTYASLAYVMADAMIAAREQQEPAAPPQRSDADF